MEFLPNFAKTVLISYHFFRQLISETFKKDAYEG